MENWLVLTGTWLDYDFPYIGKFGNGDPNWRTQIFQRGTTNQMDKSWKVGEELGIGWQFVDNHGENGG